MRIDAIKRENFGQNNYQTRNRKNLPCFGLCTCAKESKDTKCESYDIKRLRAVVTGMIMTGFAVIAAILWFSLTKNGKPNARVKK